MELIDRLFAPLFQSGQIADVVIAVMVIEALALAAWRLRTGRGPGLFPVATNLLAGVALLIALRLALMGTHWLPIALALLGAFVFHLADLRARWPT
ncbi:MAG: hypothetical protein NW216_10500 [Hyphomicrobium sp.]|nr:hypothetical protein [Hyphomicrobium sp.]